MLVPIQSPFCAFRFCSHDFFSTSNICWHTDSQTSFLVTCSSNLHLPETSQLLFSQQLQVKHPSNIVPNKFVYTLFAFCLQISYWSYHKQEIKKMGGTKGKNMSKFMKLSANLCKQSQINPDIPKAKHKLNQQTTKEWEVVDRNTKTHPKGQTRLKQQAAKNTQNQLLVDKHYICKILWTKGGVFLQYACAYTKSILCF
jgi:hypothetical protein